MSKATLTVSEVLLGLECELELWLCEFSCGEQLGPEMKQTDKKNSHFQV